MQERVEAGGLNFLRLFGPKTHKTPDLELEWLYSIFPALDIYSALTLHHPPARQICVISRQKRLERPSHLDHLDHPACPGAPPGRGLPGARVERDLRDVRAVRGGAASLGCGGLRGSSVSAAP